MVALHTCTCPNEAAPRYHSKKGAPTLAHIFILTILQCLLHCLMATINMQFIDECLERSSTHLISLEMAGIGANVMSPSLSPTLIHILIMHEIL